MTQVSKVSKGKDKKGKKASENLIFDSPKNKKKGIALWFAKDDLKVIKVNK